MSEICVIGAGPAGSTIAARLAQFGHAVHIVERARFPRSRLGESLTPGVLPLLATAGLADGLADGAVKPRGVRIQWQGAMQTREAGDGLIVDRGRFDRQLLRNACACGVKARQPARVVSCARENGKWRVLIEGESGAEFLEFDFIVDARGRRRIAGGEAGPRTIALHRYWRCARLPETPVIEAGEDGWFWGVPLPDGLTNTILFVDPARWRARRDLPVEARFDAWIDRSGLMAGCGDAAPCGPVRASDATPYRSNDAAGRDFLRVGDAAVAIDAISSSGVQKAVRSALAAAVVVNTLLRKPERADAALAFYDAQLRETFETHRDWAARHYAEVAGPGCDPFWSARAAGATPEPPPAPPMTVEAIATGVVALSPDVAIRPTPCLDTDYVSLTDALHHPGLPAPVAWLAGFQLAPLLERLPANATPLQIARSWETLLPLRTGLAIAGWMVDHGILVQRPARREHI
jgi:flavin-dependent dehydrogenase